MPSWPNMASRTGKFCARNILRTPTHLNRDKIESDLSVPGIQGHHDKALVKSFQMRPHLVSLGWHQDPFSQPLDQFLIFFLELKKKKLTLVLQSKLKITKTHTLYHIHTLCSCVTFTFFSSKYLYIRYSKISVV